METVTFRVEKGFLKRIEAVLKELNYSTKTEFIRDALRKSLDEAEKERMLKRLEYYRGLFKDKLKPITDEEWTKLRHEAGEEYFRKMEEKFKINQK